MLEPLKLGCTRSLAVTSIDARPRPGGPFASARARNRTTSSTASCKDDEPDSGQAGKAVARSEGSGGTTILDGPSPKEAIDPTSASFAPTTVSAEDQSRRSTPSSLLLNG